MTSRPLPIRAVLFDRDDTIAQTDPSVYKEAALWTAQKHGLDPRLVGHTLAELWKQKAFTWWDLRSHEDEEAFWATYGLELTTRLGLAPVAAPELMAAFPYERYLKPVANAREVLGELREQGLKIGVLSNTLPSIDRTLKAVGLDDLVDVALSTCLLGVHKPDPQAFQLAAEALEVQPSQVLFIDDKQENVDAAKQLGMRAKRINLHQPEAGAIHDLQEVLTLVSA